MLEEHWLVRCLFIQCFFIEIYSHFNCFVCMCTFVCFWKLFLAHPSCLNYSKELVEQIRSDGSWQCIDCKACFICNGTGDPVRRVFSLLVNLLSRYFYQMLILYMTINGDEFSVRKKERELIRLPSSIEL